MAVVSHTRELKQVLFSQLDCIKDNKITDDVIESLLLTCGDSMLLAALDLIDSNEGKPCRAHCCIGS